MDILHIIRDIDIIENTLYREIIHSSNKKDTAVVLIQDGVYCNCDALIEKINIYACKEDVEARNWSTSIPLIDYLDIIDMIFSHKKVICW